jgi:TerC family integral membrane protein
MRETPLSLIFQADPSGIGSASQGWSMNNPVWMVLLTAFFLGMLVLDLGVFHRRPHEISTREAAVYSGIWVALSLVFGTGLYLLKGPESGVQFFTGYLLEKSLSLDNLFLLAVIFETLAIPLKYQHRVLYYGVLGALILRGAFIAAGTALLVHIHWAFPVLGMFLLFAGVKLLSRHRSAVDPRTSGVVRWAQRAIPMVQEFGGSFFIRRNRRWFATPLFLALVMIEVTDLVLAADSIPAILSVTQEPLIVYSSSMFAVLGLRSLYFLLAGVTSKLRYLHTGLAAILIFLGGKMLVGHFVEVPTQLSLGVVSGILLLTVFASVYRARRDRGFAGQPARSGQAAFPKEGLPSTKPRGLTNKIGTSK